MKVLYVSSFDESHKAGYYNAVMDRIKVLRRKRELDIVSLNFSKGRFSDNIDLNVHIPFFLCSKPVLRVMTELYLLLWVLYFSIRFKSEVIHVHWAYPIGYAATVAGKIAKIPVVVTCHGSDIHTNPNAYKFIRSRTNACLKNAHSIMVVGHSLKNILIENFSIPSSKIFVTPNGLDLKYYKPQAVSPKSSKDKVVVGFVGNLNTTKGADLLPSIYEKLTELIDSKVKLVVVGDGPLKAELTRIFEGEEVKFLGHIARQKVVDVIRECDLIVMPSRKEGFGIIALESFLLGTPCIAFKIPDLKDVFLHNLDLLVDSKNNDVNMFAYKCASVIRNLDFDLSQEKYIDEFSLESLIDLEVEKYYSAVS
ncbi:glycosyltransferase [Vibrio vulnificus]